MYCRHCGNEVPGIAVVCVKCGCPPKSGRNFCYSCKAETSYESPRCPSCHYIFSESCDKPITEGYDFLTTILLCWFAGVFGVHRFYTGHTAIGIVQLFTLGGCGIWVLVDLIMIAVGSYTDVEGRPLVRK